MLNPNRRASITVLFFVLAMLVIACSVSSLMPTTTSPLPGTQVSTSSLGGTWQDPQTSDTYLIAWQNGKYVVVSCTWEGTNYTIISQSWTGKTLTWSYNDTDLNLTVTITTTSLSGDSLNINWSYSDGTSGTGTLGRVK